MKLIVALIAMLLLFTAPAFSEPPSSEVGQLEKHADQLFIFVLVLLTVVAGLLVVLQIINQVHQKDIHAQDEKIEAQQKQIETQQEQIEALQRQMETRPQERVVGP